MKLRLILLALATLAATAQATVLTFDTGGGMPQTYGDNVTNTTMGAYSYGETGEGFTPDIVVEYIGDGGDGLDFWGAGYGDLVNVVENEDDGERWTILRFTAALGSQTVLHSMDLGNYNSGSLLIDSITITNESGAVLFQTNNFTLAGSGSGHTNVNFGAVSGRKLTLVLDLQTAAVSGDNDSIGLDNIIFSQTGTALFPDAVATDGDVPSNLYPGGTEDDPALYIIGATNAFVRDFGATPLSIGYVYGTSLRASYVTLLIRNGSTVLSGDDSSVGTYYDVGSRLARLTQASSWIVDGELAVPASGNNDRLEVFGGSLVTTTNLIVAGASYCTGSVVVSNANSRVISTGALGGGTATGAGSYIYMEDHGLVRVDGDYAYCGVAYFNEGFFAWAGDHTSDSGNPFNDYRVWSGTNWQDLATGPIQFTETYYATDAEAKLATADPASGFAGYDGLGGYTVWTSYIEVPQITNTLTVISEYGNPDPPVGANEMLYGTTGTCTVEQVTFGTTNYSPIGWTMTGNAPFSGTTNWFIGTLTNDAVLTWNWQTNYWLDVNVTGSGTVSHVDGFYSADSSQNLIATPDAGWLFLGWSGDASGTNSAAVTMDAPKTVMALFSDDADNDGLTNSEEAAIGSNPWKYDTDDDGFDDKLEVDHNWNPTVSDQWAVDYIGANGHDFELYPSNVVLDVAVGEMLLEMVGGNASLNLQLEQSEDLITWTNAGEAVEWTLSVDGGKKYFRVRAEP